MYIYAKIVSPERRWHLMIIKQSDNMKIFDKSTHSPEVKRD